MDMRNALMRGDETVVMYKRCIPCCKVVDGAGRAPLLQLGRCDKKVQLHSMHKVISYF